jgi:undecaprenyl diphosphate synthase
MQPHFTPQSETIPEHTAIIMDGNGRWAEARGLPRIAGHRAGADVARRIIEAAPGLGIRTLTLFTFSADNWKRPRAEVDALMSLLSWHLRKNSPECARKGVRISLIGRRDRLPASVVSAARYAESKTSAGTNLHVRFAIDYSGRDAILNAALQTGSSSRDAISDALGADVDLLIRSGGEHRLSDFLLWECAYAELHFTSRMWPDFSEEDLREAVDSFRSRTRRFGGLSDSLTLGQSCFVGSSNANEPGRVHQLRGDRWLR